MSKYIAFGLGTSLTLMRCGLFGEQKLRMPIYSNQDYSTVKLEMTFTPFFDILYEEFETECGIIVTRRSYSVLPLPNKLHLKYRKLSI